MKTHARVRRATSKTPGSVVKARVFFPTPRSAHFVIYVVDKGICMQAYEVRMAHDVIFLDKLCIWGWGLTPALARATAVTVIYDSAATQGALRWAVDLGLEPKFLVKAHQRALRIRACYPHPDESPTPTAPSSKCKPSCKGFKPPVVQSLVKWRSEERNPIPRMKFRDIYAYVGTPLKHTSQVVSRCMQVLYMQALQAVQTMGLPTMLGVRDLWSAVQRITNVAVHMHLCERDMDDMYWRIPKAQVIQAQVDTAKWVAKWRPTRRRGYTRLTHQHVFQRVSHSSANNFGPIRQITYSK